MQSGLLLTVTIECHVSALPKGGTCGIKTRKQGETSRVCEAPSSLNGGKHDLSFLGSLLQGRCQSPLFPASVSKFHAFNFFSLVSLPPTLPSPQARMGVQAPALRGPGRGLEEQDQQEC